MTTIFERDTLLDLTVNFIPLGIILFFGVGYLIFNPWRELGLFGDLIMIGLHAVPFIGLAILTYVSGKAIAGDEQRSEVYYQGQAAVEDSRTREEVEAELHGEEGAEQTDEGAGEEEADVEGESDEREEEVTPEIATGDDETGNP